MSSAASQFSAGHLPVMAHEVVDSLAIEPDGVFIDGTYGRGGHTYELLSRLESQAQLIGLDRDPDAIADAKHRFAHEPRFSIEKANFSELEEVVTAKGLLGKVDGLLLDLGVSSPQLDTAERGFGFSRDGQLDMRMDTTSGLTAAAWLADVSEQELAQVLKDYGEERYAKRIARAIVDARALQPIFTTSQLAEIVKAAHPNWERHHHPATRSFQAIRIHINGELSAIRLVLEAAARVLRQGGRIAIITFHSLEDRIVKRALRKPVPDSRIPRHLPQPSIANHPWRLVGKARKPKAEEIASNPRSRSATLRVAERVL